MLLFWLGIEMLTADADSSSVLALTDHALHLEADWEVHQPLLVELWRMAGSCLEPRYRRRPAFAREGNALLPLLNDLYQRLPGKKAPSLCVLCIDKKANVVVNPCGHVCLCITCRPYFEQMQGAQRCPLCSQNVISLISLFFS